MPLPTPVPQPKCLLQANALIPVDLHISIEELFSLGPNLIGLQRKNASPPESQAFSLLDWDCMRAVCIHGRLSYRDP